MSGPMEMTALAAGCDHRGLWVLREIDSGLGLRMCEGCGGTFVLAQLDDGRFAWMRVLEHEEAVDDLAEALRALQAGPAEQSVPPRPQHPRRPRKLVPGVQAAAGPAAPAADGAGVETLRNVRGMAAYRRLQPLGTGGGRAPDRVSCVPTRKERP